MSLVIKMDWYLSNLKLKIKNINEEQFNFLNYALPYSSDEIISEFSFDFNNVNNNYAATVPTNVFKLSNQIIYICQSKYFVDYLDGRKGVWDCINKMFTYNFGDSPNVRHWFMQAILDPLSISCVPYNKVIVHGALWTYKNQGILVMGNSGSGKSTISCLLKDTVKVLSDDVMMVSFKGNSFWAEPINVGFGVSITSPLSNCAVADDVLVVTKKKKYLKSLYSLADTNDKKAVPLRFVLILRKGCDTDTHVETPVLSDAIKTVLNLQTNIKNPYLYSKFLLFKKMLSECDVRFVNYLELCNIEKVRECIVKGGEQ